MKMYEALSMLCAARDGVIPNKRQAVIKYGMRSKRTLSELGMKERINEEYPADQLEYGLFLLCNHPTEFAKQARASAAWLINRN
jgi:hypothetical protein